MTRPQFQYRDICQLCGENVTYLHGQSHLTKTHGLDFFQQFKRNLKYQDLIKTVKVPYKFKYHGKTVNRRI